MTAQVPDVLLIDAEYHSVLISMTETPPLPMSPRIVFSEDPGELAYTTACWRKHQALWEIKDSALYLKDLRGRLSPSGNDPILADHFTGVLRVPMGSLLSYQHMGFGSAFSEKLRITIKRGLVAKKRLVDIRRANRQMKRLKLILAVPWLIFLVTVVLPIALIAIAL